MNTTNIILTVDWEPNHGKRKKSLTSIDYSGIENGTPLVCDVLDKLKKMSQK